MTEREVKQLERISEKLAHMKAQRNDILARDRKRQQRERTRRLIKLGELVEQNFDYREVHPPEVEMFLRMFVNMQGVEERIDFVKQSIFHREAQE